jgi:hypothetical protein
LGPDLTPLDFLFWGYVKDCVYVHEILDLIHFKAIMKAANQQE